MSSHTATMNGQQQQKFTRYKSVRKASAASATSRPYGNGTSPPPPVPNIAQMQVGEDTNPNLSRSMSRYKRPRAQTAGAASSNRQETPVVPKIPSNYSHQQQQPPLPTNNSTMAKQRNFSAPVRDQSQFQPPSRSSTFPNPQQQAHMSSSMPQSQSLSHTGRRETVSSRGQATLSNNGATAYPDAFAPTLPTVVAGQPQFVAPMAGYPAQAQGQAYAMPISEEDKIRHMIEADKARQRRLREEQKKREAVLAAEKAEKQRLKEEEQRHQEEEERRKEEEQRLVKEKLEEAKRQHAERKKQQSRKLFSRSGQNGRGDNASNFSRPERKYYKSSGEYGHRYEDAPEDLNERTASDMSDNENARLPAQHTSRYRSRQSPAKTRKESLSSPRGIHREGVSSPVSSTTSPTSPLSPITPLSPLGDIRKDAISQPLTIGMPRPSMSQRPGILGAADTFFDAPKTGGNAGERSVIVWYGDFKTVVNVELDTTSEDLLRLAAKEMPRADIEPSNDVLMECFGQQEHQGLERRMRRYEIVQKTMDSWDSDRGNRLSIIKGNVGGTDGDLYASAVRRRGEPKETTTVRMYYSSSSPSTKPSWGTFERLQTCILRPDGQVLVGSDERTATACCHMADFEIFIPTPEQVRRIRPRSSKKVFVFAIKSTNKAAVYMESSNYVHYFCTKDRADADRWYIAAQAWRSWYLVERLGWAGGGGGVSAGWIGKLSIEKTGGVGSNGLGASRQAANTTSAAGSGFGTGFGNLLDSGKDGEDIFSSIMNKYSSTANTGTSGAVSNNRSPLHDGPDLSKDALGYDLGGLISRIPMNEHSYDESNNNSSSLNRTNSARRGGKGNTLVSPSSEEPFSPGGLLGRSYSQRKQQQEITGRSTQAVPPVPSVPELDRRRAPLVDFSHEPAGNASGGGGGSARRGGGDTGGPLIGKIG